MKKALTLFLFFCGLTTGLLSQESKRPKERLKEYADTLSVSIKEKTGKVMETVFKPEPLLNNADSIRKAFDDQPSFGIFKNNYIITGTTVHPDKISSYTSDAKIQISVRQRLSNSVLPFKTYLFLTYTQLAFWDIYKDSFPFGEISFNPTVGLGKVLSYNNRFLGSILFQLEHESNGLDGVDSRSWNKASFFSMFVLNNQWAVQSKIWIPIVDGTNNKDIVNYKGWAQIAVDYRNKNHFNAGMLLTKRAGGFFDYNVVINASLKLFEKHNQHLFLEYYNGYGESLFDYNQPRHRIRVGFVIQPSLLRVY